VTPDILQMLKVNGSEPSRSQRDITYQHQKIVMSRTDRLTEFKLGENYLRSLLQHVTCVQVQDIKYKIATTPRHIVWFWSNLVQSLTMSQLIYYQCSRSKIKVTA